MKYIRPQPAALSLTYRFTHPALQAAFPPQRNTLSAATGPLGGSGDEHDDLLLESGAVGALAVLARSIVRLVGLGLDELTDAVARLDG
jgi:hypothetical protein